MFIGHLAVGFAGKKAAPRASLPVLLLAANWVDVLWSIFLLGGLEVARIRPGDTKAVPLEFVSYPWSHSLLMTAVWAAVFGGVYWMVSARRREAIILSGIVLSHWFLDAVSHRADMPLRPGGPWKAGLGLYNSIGGTVAVEGALLALGVGAYISATRPDGKSGSIALWAFVGLVLALYGASLFGPPAPDIRTVALGNMVFLPLLLWAARIDQARKARTSCRSPWSRTS